MPEEGVYEKRLALLKPVADVRREEAVRTPELYLYDDVPPVLVLLDPV